jgi:hypothetical protein
MMKNPFYSNSYIIIYVFIIYVFIIYVFTIYVFTIYVFMCLLLSLLNLYRTFIRHVIILGATFIVASS